MKNEPTPQHGPGVHAPARHQFEHATPTVIHDPEQDMMLLARWVHRAMQNPGKFWGWLLGGTAAVLALVILANLFSGRSSSSAAAWNNLDSAQSADDKLEVAKANPGSPVAAWAKLNAATQLYQSGVSDLPSNSDAAVQTLKKAADLFDELAKSESKDSPVAISAAFGLARCLEARNELSKAVAQYKLVADTWPDAPEAPGAKRLAEALQKPEAAAFYKDLYAFKPTKVNLPPLGTETLDFPDVVPSPTDAAAPGESLIPPPPPPTDASKADEPKAEAAPSEEPKVEEPKPEAAPSEEPKAEEPKAEEPKPEAAPSEEPKAEEPKV